MLDEPRLRELAREAVRIGRLPARRQNRTWGGPGAGDPCAVCGTPVAKEMEISMSFAHDGDSPGLDKFHLHVCCFAAWEFERTNGSN